MVDSIFNNIHNNYREYAFCNTPHFVQDVLDNMNREERRHAEDICKGSVECIFDYAVTGRDVTLCISKYYRIYHLYRLVKVVNIYGN